MKILEINTVPYGSTGKIMFGIANIADSEGLQVYTSAGYSTHPLKPLPDKYLKIGGFFSKGSNKVLANTIGGEGLFSYFATLRFLHKVKKISPDIVHLHNLHGYYINLPLLFRYLKSSGTKVIWTLHDCWSFTGHCPYFTIAKCEKWKTACHSCPNFRDYPSSLIDDSRIMHKLKKRLFLGLENMTIVTPSRWLSDLARESFLGAYPVRVINNGIDLNIFKPTESDFRKKYGIPDDKFILLGVAFGWGIRKGLDVFIDLATKLDQDKYQIVLVGTDDKVDSQLPQNIISIHRTQNQTELATIYTAADLFVNPTREENYPTVNMESIACGTPVLTFDTGGSPECITEKTGAVVPCDDNSALITAIERIRTTHPYSPEDCVTHATTFDMTIKYQEYLQLYKEN